MKEKIITLDPTITDRRLALGWDWLLKRYFRLEVTGWENIPDTPCLFIGVHSGGPLCMDAWTLPVAWWKHFRTTRTIHTTSHDMVFKVPFFGKYIRNGGGISANKDAIIAAINAGHDVMLWPGGVDDAARVWTKRDTAILGGRTGFIRLAKQLGIPIVPVATVGGHDTLFVLSEGRGLAKFINTTFPKIKKMIRTDVIPITLSFPLGVTLHVLPLQNIPLPSKIRTEFLKPIYLTSMSDNPTVEEVKSMYSKVESTIQEGMTRLAKKRKFPIFG